MGPPLHVAAQFNSDKVANFLNPERCKKLDAEEKDKWTPLHVAAQYNSDKVANLLIQNGAKIDAVDKNKATPSSLCCSGEQRQGS